MFTPWELVRPRVWHPMASLEQSMMDFDRMTESLFATPPRFSLFDHDHDLHDDDDFFSDLPVRRRTSSQQQHNQQTKQPQQQHGQPQQPEQQPQHSQQQQNQPERTTSSTYSGYSFSSSTIFDDKGQRITSTRRRYEDSTGRLKAVHERQIGDKKLRTVWNKMHKEDEGKHEQTLLGHDTSGASIEDFESEWKQTAFGEAEAKRQAKQQALKEKGESS